jgi:hypothetical protein
MGQMAKELGLDCWQEQEIFLFSGLFDLGPTQPLV